MECAKCKERLSAYLDQETTAPETLAIQRHLEVCEGCRRELAALRRLSAALGDLAVPAPAGLARQVRRRLAPRRAPWQRAMSLAASLVLGMVAGGGITKGLYHAPGGGNGSELAALEEVLQDFPPSSWEGIPYHEDEDRSA